MAIEFLDHTLKCDPVVPMNSFSAIGQALLKACYNYADFEVIGTYNLDNKMDVIVGTITSGKIPSKNKNNILKSERIAIIYLKDLDDDIPPYQVVSLRKDFPVTLHQNGFTFIHKNAKCLCLYENSWHDIKYSWNFYNFLENIKQWMERVANDSLHTIDQEPEPLYFYSGVQVVLPDDFFETVNRDNLYIRGNNDCLIVDYSDEWVKNDNWDVLYLDLGSVRHGKVRNPPKDLFGFNEILLGLGIDDFIEKLCKNASEYSVKKNPLGIDKSSGRGVLLFYKLKIYSDENKFVSYNRGFYIKKTIVELGVILGFFRKVDDLYLVNSNFDFQLVDTIDLKKITLESIDILPTPTKKLFNKMAGVTGNVNGILAGVGALGGVLAELWARIGWGEWTVVDEDILKPHNLARHNGLYNQIGLSKVDIIKDKLENIAAPNSIRVNAISEKVNNKNLFEIFENFDIFVDVTTTIDVCRSLHDQKIRKISTFLNHNGNCSVLIIEDLSGINKIDYIEPQYYYHLINSTWGELYLNNKGVEKVGVGCSSFSTVISYENIYLHGGLISKNIRKFFCQQDSFIVVNVVNEDLGVDSYIYNVENILCKKLGDWVVVYSDIIKNKLEKYRLKNLPNETGGVILGYYDFLNKKVYVVDVLDAPVDSLSKADSFVRGSDGVLEGILKINELTAGNVIYIGEWHSHPENTSIEASKQDIESLNSIANELYEIGTPPIMIIVGDKSLNIYIKDNLYS